MLGRNCLSAMALAALATVMASVAVAQTTTFSRQPALAVPDNTSVSDSMVISGVAGNISTLTLELRINHTWDADLNIYLIPPGTTWAGPYTGVPPANVVEICTGNGGSGDNFGTGTTPPFVYTRFSSATDPLNPGTIAITAGTAPFTAGVYTPEGTAAFGALYGTNPNGTWTLALADTASGDAGLVLEWRLIVSDTPGDPEINVQQPAGTNRTSGSIVSLGSTVAGIAQNLTFTVQNIGATQNLNVTSISGAATGVANCTVTTGALTPASPIAPAGSSTFGVTVTPTAAGPFECTVTISNNDANEGTYTILIQGVGESVTSTFPYTQTFETFPLDITNPVPLPAASNWVNLTNDGGVQDWYVDSGGTPSANTGPAVDHTLGTAAGIYLYVEDSNTPQGEVNLLTPWFNLSGLVAPVASFWVHANDANAGANDNTLHIDVINATTSTTDLDVITPIGHVADATLTVWTRVNIALAAYVGNTIRIRFRLEDNGGSFSHDVAIDDFDLRDFPEMDVQRPASTSIASGGTDNVGGVLTTGANFVYTIANTGGAVLNLTGTAPNYVVVTPGTGTPTVSVTVQPANTVAASGSVTFTINVVPAAGAFDFAVSIANDDPNENPYTFTVSGTGVTNAPPVLALGSPTDFTAGSDFDLTVQPGASLAGTNGAVLRVTDATPDPVNATITFSTGPQGATPPAGIVPPANVSGGAGAGFNLTWTGTANATNTPGTYVWNVLLTDGVSNVNRSVRITIANLAPAHVVVAPTTGTGALATPYAATIQIGSTTAINIATVSDGNTGQNVSFVSQSLTASPAGSSATHTFSVSPASGNPVTLVCTPSAAVLADLGDFDYTILVQDDTSPTPVQSTIYVRITIAGTAPSITSTALTTAAVGISYNYQVTATGNPSTFTFSASGLPAWLSISGTGLISGTPAAGDIGTTGTITVTVANGITPNATQNFSITVAAAVAPAITSTAVTTATEGTAYTYTFTLTGNPTPTLSLTTGTLPAWLTLSGNTLSGTPPAGSAATYGPFTFTATNGVTPDATQTFSIVVSAPSSGGGGDDDEGCSTGSKQSWLMLAGLLAALGVALRTRKARA